MKQRNQPSDLFRKALHCLLMAFLLSTAWATVAAQEHPGSGTAESRPQEAPVQAHEGPATSQHPAEAADETEQFKHSASVRWISRVTGLGLEHAYWLSVFLNFAVVLGVILWASVKWMPGVFRARTASIQQAMLEARKASEEAQRRLAEIERRLSRLDAEIAQMQATAENDAAAEDARTKTAAEEEVRKIVESAEQEIAAAAKTARRDLTAYVADLAVSLAEKQIKVDATTDQALIKEFSQNLSSQTNSRRGQS